MVRGLRFVVVCSIQADKVRVAVDLVKIWEDVSSWPMCALDTYWTSLGKFGGFPSVSGNLPHPQHCSNLGQTRKKKKLSTLNRQEINRDLPESYLDGFGWIFHDVPDVHPWRLTWNIIMEVGRSFSFLNGWCVGSMFRVSLYIWM